MLEGLILNRPAITCLHCRYAIIARRDLSLFYLQYAIMFMYSVMVGLLYHGLDYAVNEDVRNVFGAISWITALALFVFLFKAVFNAEMYSTLVHERANHAYGRLANTLADLSVFLVYGGSTDTRHASLRLGAQLMLIAMRFSHVSCDELCTMTVYSYKRCMKAM